MVWFKITTLLRLEELCDHGHNNKHMVNNRGLGYEKKQLEPEKTAVFNVIVRCFAVPSIHPDLLTTSPDFAP